MSDDPNKADPFPRYEAQRAQIDEAIRRSSVTLIYGSGTASVSSNLRLRSDMDGGSVGVHVPGEPVERCRTYWGSHGCKLRRGHDRRAQPCICSCCDCTNHRLRKGKRHDPDEGYEYTCAGQPPYYGPTTTFYGEDAPILVDHECVHCSAGLAEERGFQFGFCCSECERTKRACHTEVST